MCVSKRGVCYFDGFAWQGFLGPSVYIGFNTGIERLRIAVLISLGNANAFVSSSTAPRRPKLKR
jgi:hypothetical protein